MMKKIKAILMTVALFATSSMIMAGTATWSKTWEKTGEKENAFYNRSSSFVDKDTLSTTINDLLWYITSQGTKCYYTLATGGQCIGISAEDASSRTSFYTNGFSGKILSVRINAKKNSKEGTMAYLKVSVNGKSYQTKVGESALDSVFLSNDHTQYEFKPNAEGEIGKLDIQLYQPSDVKSILCIKSIEVDYEVTLSPGDDVPGDDTPVVHKATFQSDEANSPYYTQGFDNSEDLTDWELYYTNENYTFNLSSVPTLSPSTSFSTIDPKSTHSLNIKYSEKSQDEKLYSPAIMIKPNTTLEFYTYFSGVFLVYANWTVEIVDIEKGKINTMVDGFKWAQENAYTGPAWIRFNADLSEYAGREVQILFHYKGANGDDVAFDGLKLLQTDESADAQATIQQGGSVHFHAKAEEGDICTWSFPGGTVINDDNLNPIVTYSKVGTYDVQLTIKRGDKEDTLLRKDYVNVKAEMPKAIAALPTEGYLSPHTGIFIPVNHPVTFSDHSTGNPTDRYWQFQGTDIDSSTEANPTVTYVKAGTYSVGLKVSNEVGTDTDILAYAIQAGGAQYIWNIGIEESQSLDAISMSWYGYYAGTNWLGMTHFSERFDAPLAPATIDSVGIFFASTQTITPDTAIVVSIQAEGKDGYPGEVLASGSVLAKDLTWDDETVVATIFKMNKTAQITGPFFVTISGMPNNTDPDTYKTDNIAILCARRNAESRNTAYHYCEIMDSYTPTGEFAWYANTDDPLSMAICPVLSYGFTTAINEVQAGDKKRTQARKVMIDGHLHIQQGERLYDMLGKEVR